jgi:hypothetical protein
MNRLGKSLEGIDLAVISYSNNKWAIRSHDTVKPALTQNRIKEI